MKNRYAVYKDKIYLGSCSTHQEIGTLIGASRQHITNQICNNSTITSYGQQYFVLDKVMEFTKLFPNLENYFD
jgi:hypothetical protein